MAAITKQLGDTAHPGEWRLFGLDYHDYRDDIVKADNRPFAAQHADGRHINIGTFGGHYIRAISARPGTTDLLPCLISVDTPNEAIMPRTLGHMKGDDSDVHVAGLPLTEADWGKAFNAAYRPRRSLDADH